METWLSIWSIGQNSSLEAFKKIKEAGFDGIEIWAEHIHSKDYFDYAVQSDLKVSVHLPFHDLNLATPDPIVYERTVHILKQWLERLADYGGRHATFHGGYAWSSEERDETLNTVQNRIKRLNEHAKKLGLELLLENLIPDRLNYCHHVASNLEEWVELARAANVKTCLDTGHLAVMGEDLETAITKLGNLLGAVHLSENDGRADLHQLPGEGNQFTNDLFNILAKHQFSGPVVYEINPYQYSLQEIADHLSRYNQQKNLS